MAETKKLTNSILSEVFVDAVANRGICQDFNLAENTGFYRVDSAKNAPASDLFGILVVFRHSSYSVLQILFSLNGKIYVRIRWEYWRSWKAVTPSGLA